MHIIIPAPAVFEARAGRQAVRRGVKIAVFVEGRVGSDKMHGLAIHTAQKIKVVAMIQRSVLEVKLCQTIYPAMMILFWEYTICAATFVQCVA